MLLKQDVWDKNVWNGNFKCFISQNREVIHKLRNHCGMGGRWGRVKMVFFWLRDIWMNLLFCEMKHETISRNFQRLMPCCPRRSERPAFSTARLKKFAPVRALKAVARLDGRVTEAEEFGRCLTLPTPEKLRNEPQPLNGPDSILLR